MAPEWTPAQLSAIDTRGCDLLISAAAGSGKTAALTERIIRSLTREENPADITRILAVTFTRASAAELRRRISKALSERLAADPGNKHLIRQLMLLGSAKIRTIDSFYNEIVKSNFQKLNLPAGFRIADDAELKLLEHSVMEDLIDRSFADKHFADLADNFTGNKDDRQLSDFFIGLYESVRKFPEGTLYLKTGAGLLEREAEKEFFSTCAGNLIALQLTEELGYYLRILDSACAEFRDDDKLRAAYFDGFCSDRDHIAALLEAIGSSDYERTRKTTLLYAPRKLNPLKTVYKTPRSDSLKAWRDKIRDRLKELPGTEFRRPGDAIPGTFRKTAGVCLDLYNFVSKYEEELHGEKISRGICDFEDIRRYTLTLLIDSDGNPTDTARSYASQFDEILIDEYQDVDMVQDLIFRALSVSSKRFMVGDIKQSIYGFRGAEPSLFSGYRKAFPELVPGKGKIDDSGMSIFMSDNFRCDENVVRFVNLICSRIFPACGSSVGYVPADDLIFSKKTDAGYISPPVSVTLIHKGDKTLSGNSEDDGDSPNQPANTEKADDAADREIIALPEMRFIASEISRLLREGKKADGTPVKPGDIAVLCRARNTCANVSDVLKAIGIPTVSDSAEEYYSDPGVSLMISLLTVIDNPQKDIPAAAVMHSPLFGFTMDDLAAIRKNAGKTSSLYDAAAAAAEAEQYYSLKCQRFIERIESYRVLSRSLPADRLMRHIMRDTPVFSLTGGSDNKKSTRLLGLYEYARQFEAGSFKGLYNFVKYINNAIEADAGLGPEGAEPGADAVTVITIHHSKGLEFPVCFVAGCAMKFNAARNAKSDFIPDRTVGPAVRIKDKTGLAKVNTQIREAALINAGRKETEEEMRLLYVAMTRARERLYLTAYYPYKLENKLYDADFRRQFGGDFGVLSAGCYLDWLLLSISEGQPKGAPYIFNILTDSEVPEPLPVDLSGKTIADTTITYNTSELEKLLDERFAYTYPYAHLTGIPAKLSVSRLYPGVLDEGHDAGAQLAEDGGITNNTKTVSGSVDMAADADSQHIKVRVPEFIAGENTGAGSTERGTATHVFLQFCDFIRCRENSIEEELAYLTEKHFISERMAGLVDLQQIERFFESDFYASLSRARWVRREQRFNILLPAALFTEKPDFSAVLEGEELLVQGVIDLFFEDADGNLILADYKTDRLTRDEIADPRRAAAKLGERHGTQLSYYSAALSRICGRRPNKVLIYSLPLGGTVEVEIKVF